MKVTVTRVAMAVPVILIGALMISRRPILFRVVDATELTRDPIVVFKNPLRDKGPEVAAERILRELRDRKLASAFLEMGSSADDRVRESETQYPIHSWRLVDRKDEAGKAKVVYAVKRHLSPPVITIVTFRATRVGRRWSITGYEPVY